MEEKKEIKKKKHAGGRPSGYNKKLHPKLAFALGKLGLPDKLIAEELEITEQTLNNWKNKHPEFFESLKEGKSKVDEQVKSALLRNALGYEEEDVKIFCDHGDLVYAPYTKKYKPDTTSQIFWLKNRMPEEFREKKEIDLNNVNIVIKRNESND